MPGSVFRYIVLAVCCWFLAVGFASAQQETKISGMIFDAQTREPLPFVNIKYKGVKVFTTTDIDGNFSLSTTTPSDTLVISYIGYRTKKIKIQRNISVTKNISLEPDQMALAEVVILPGENPAHKILRKVVEHKDHNDIERLKSYEYEVYNKIEIDFNNIPKSYKDKLVLRPVKFIFDYIDSTSVTEKPYLPVFLSEAISDFFYLKNPQHHREIIKASKVSGFQEASLSQFMGQMYQNFNIYDNTILAFQKRFESPIANNSLIFYKYYLIDSVFVDNSWCYQIQFKPRRKQELTFQGNMWISDTTFAIKRIEMSMASDANINFVNTFNIVQDYDKVDSTWMLSKDRLVVDFNLQKDKMGFYGRKNSSYKNIIINKPRPEDFYSSTENIELQDSALLKNDEYWKKSRHDTLSKNEKQVYKMVDTIQSLPIYRTWYDWIVLLTGGYYTIGKIDLGPYYKLFSSNSVEGQRFRIGARTGRELSKWYQFNGYIGYGLKDKVFKYGLGYQAFLTKKPRQVIGLNYMDDVEILGQSTNAYAHDNFLSTLFRTKPLSSLTAIQQYKASYEFEPFQGFNNKLILTHKIMIPKGDQSYNYLDETGAKVSQSNIFVSDVSAVIRFAYRGKYLGEGFNRTWMGTRYPVVELQYSEGLRGVLKSQYQYHKVTMRVEDRIRISPFGYTDYIIQAGKIFGNVPFPLLELHGGNETVVYDPFAYNMMNYYEFASDQFLDFEVFHHFDGFFLNHIPLMRKLKWREVISGKYLVGNVESKNRDVLIFPTTLSSLDHGPYYEASAGIENIFMVFRIDAVWRLSYINKSYVDYYTANGGKSIPVFGIRFGMQITF